jgi:hypothetical protein
METDGVERLCGSRHGVPDNRMEMAELGAAEPPSGPPDGHRAAEESRAKLSAANDVDAMRAQHSIPLN